MFGELLRHLVLENLHHLRWHHVPGAIVGSLAGMWVGAVVGQPHLLGMTCSTVIGPASYFPYFVRYSCSSVIHSRFGDILLSTHQLPIDDGHLVLGGLIFGGLGLVVGEVIKLRRGLSREVRPL